MSRAVTLRAMACKLWMLNMRGFIKNIVLLVVFVAVFTIAQIISSLAVVSTLGGVTDVGFMLTYFIAMLLSYIAVTAMERYTFGRVAPIENSKRGFNPVAILTGVVLLIAISIVLAPLAEVLPSDSRTFPEGTFTLISVVILAPIFEEMIFRGRLYNIFHHNGSPLSAASLSALAFGVVHLEPVVIIEALIVGVVLSYFYIVRRSIIAPIILHMCNNALAYALVVLSYRGESLMELLGEGMTLTVVYATSVVIVVACFAIILRRMLVERKNERRVVEEEEEIDE